MIIPSEVAQKLESILNNASNPTGLYYQVETEGFHIDHIVAPFNGFEARNFVPVFISPMGGQFNPVKGLKQGTYTYQIVFYFPIKQKEQMFALGEYLVEQFVGQIIEYGSISGKAVSNISVPTFGEIQDLDLVKFEEWATPIYKKPIEIMEPYLTMVINLYLTSAAQGLLYGNEVKYNLTITNGETSYTLEDIDWDGASLQSNSQAQSEQEEETLESDSLPFGTTYGSSFKVYPNLETLAKESTGYTPESGTYDSNAIYYRKSGDEYILVGQISEATYNGFHSAGIPLYILNDYYFYRELLKWWLEGSIQDLECNLTMTIGDPSYGLVFNRPCYIQSIVMPIEKGQLLALTLSFAKKTQFEIENEE